MLTPPGGHLILYMLILGRKIKKSYQKTYGLELKCLLCSFLWWTSTKIVQIMALEINSAPAPIDLH